MKLVLILFDDLTKDIFVELIRGKMYNLKLDHKDELTPHQIERINFIPSKV
ncbi:MAG: hypothetical protein QXW97_04410 [Candidatus Pacearchaeota archaeon]